MATINIHHQLAFLSALPDKVSSNTKCSEQTLCSQVQDETKPKAPQQSLHLYTHSHGRTLTRVEVIQQSLPLLNPPLLSLFLCLSSMPSPIRSSSCQWFPSCQCPTPNYILLVPSYSTSPWRSGDRFSKTSHIITPNLLSTITFTIYQQPLNHSCSLNVSISKATRKSQGRLFWCNGSLSNYIFLNATRSWFFSDSLSLIGQSEFYLIFQELVSPELPFCLLYCI